VGVTRESGFEVRKMKVDVRIWVRENPKNPD
jgi:hypothetical protein